MKRPEIIEKEIAELKNQLKKSKKHYQYELLCSDNWSDEMIGFFNIGNAKQILNTLNDGKRLQYRHSVFGDVDVWMNPQKNRILVSQNENINEGNIITYIVWHSGEWYVNNTNR